MKKNKGKRKASKLCTNRRRIFCVPESKYYDEGEYKPFIWLERRGEEDSTEMDHYGIAITPKDKLLGMESLWLPVLSQVDPGVDWPGWQHLLEGKMDGMDNNGVAHKLGELDEGERRG